MSDHNPLAPLGDLSKSAAALIDKVSDAIGGIFKPWQIVRVARAEAEASLIQAESQIQVTDLHRRAGRRFIEEEAKKQLNIEAITAKAIPLLEEKSAPQNIADDWITNFFDKSRIISDSDMQQLWSRVLAGEANSSGAFSRKTVNLLADLDKFDAELFTKLCGYSWTLGNRVGPLIFDTQEEIYTRSGLKFAGLIHLTSLGFIQFQSSGFKRLKLPKNLIASYYGRPLSLTFQQEEGNELAIGEVIFTLAGHQLASVCKPSPVDGFFNFIHDRWANMALVPKRQTDFET